MSDKTINKLFDESIASERSGQVSEAIATARQAIELARSNNNPEDIATAIVRLGDIHYRLGHFEEAKNLGEQALSQAGVESRARVNAYILLGNCSMEVSTLEETEEYYQAAADLSRQIGYDQALVSALHDLGACIYALRGQFNLAFAAEEEAYRLACQINSPFKPVMLISMCFDYMLTGQYYQARYILKQLQLVISGNYLFEGFFLLLNAHLSQFEWDLPTALAYYNEVRPVAETTGDLGLNVFLRIGLSNYYRMIGNYPAAYDWANDAVAWANRVGTRRLLSRALTERGYSAWIKGEQSAAENDFRRAIEDLSSRQQAYDLARARLLLAALMHQQQRPGAEAEYIEAVKCILNGGFSYLLERERSTAFPLIAYYLNHQDPSMQVINTKLLDHLTTVPPPPLRVITMGHFEVYKRGILISAKVWRRQAGELFRLLLINPGKTLSREQIIEALWPEKSLSAATIFFHQATSSLRRVLEPDLPDKFPSRYLIVEEGQVSLYLPPGSFVDYEVFERHVNHAEWEQALDLYRGEPFDRDRYHEWASWKREQLIQQSLKALLGIAGQYLKAGEPVKALAACKRAIGEEPWNEQAVLIAMKACLLLKDRMGAVRIYLTLEHCLQEEFHVLPQTELREFYRSLEE